MFPLRSKIFSLSENIALFTALANLSKSAENNISYLFFQEGRLTFTAH